MAKGYTFDKEAFEAWKASQKESLEIQNKMNSSVSGYLETVKKIGELQKNINFIEQKVTQLKKEQAKAAQDLKDNEDKLAKAIDKKDKAEIKALEDKKEELEKILAAKKEGVAITEKELGLLKETNKQLVESAKNASAMSAVLGSAVGFLGKTPGLIKDGFGKLKQTGIFEMDKEIRNAVRSMAGGQKQYNNMLGTIQNAADTTTMWGVGVKDLAIMQRGYSEAIGRSVMLTEQGYLSMAKLAEGTGLGKEFAVQMAGEMDKFNISAERTGTIVESTMNKAAKIGVNGAAALKVFQNNLKLAQRFNFKNGIKGLADFSVQATKLRLDMEGIAGMAEKVFRPEGAIEMAAQLTTLGGKFASLGDPMQLMFEARNDPEKFAKRIGQASSEFVAFNKETGDFNIKGGLAADRMREISKVTGISVEKLQEMATAQATIEEVGKNVKGGVFDSKEMELISSFAKFKDGKWKIEAGSFSKDLKDLSKKDIERITSEQKNLEKRAEDARTFDETIQDLILTFKQQLLPLAQQLKDGLGGPIQDMVAQWKKEGFFKSLREFVKVGGEMVLSLGKWVLKAAEWLGPKGTLAVLLGGKFLFEAGKWFLNGMSLGSGFMSVAGGMGGGMGGGRPGGGMFGQRYINPRAARTVRGFSSNLRGGLRSGGAAFGGILSAGFAGYDEYSQNAAMGMGGGENAGRTASKAAGAGLGAWGGAAAGAAIGSAVPIIGTLIGGLIGGAIGSFAGSELGESIGDAIYGPEKNTKSSAIASGADTSDLRRVNDGIVFHPQDKFMQVGGNTMLASTQKGQLDKAANKLTGGSSSGQISHKFEDLKIKVEISAPTDEKVWREIFNSPEIMRRLTQEIHIATESAASGGKVTGSGPKRRGKK